MGVKEVWGLARELSYAGFLVAAAGGGYVLAPRFVVFDRQIRMADPLLRVGTPIMETMRDQVGGSQLLATSYTFCLVEHDMQFISELCDDVICMAGGRLLARGTVDRILSDEAVIAAYLGKGRAAKGTGLAGTAMEAFI